MSTGPRTISVAIAGRPYPVTVGNGILHSLGGTIAPLTRSRIIPVISDRNVWSAHGEALSAALGAAGLEPRPLIHEPGEPAKGWDGLIRTVDHLLACGTTRSDCAIAFGGGVIGDLAGFAAAIAKRGVGFVQVPTTLLAMVDSSVGGKTAINVPAGKNLVGGFHQPRAVLADTALLATLPLRERRAGWAEVVKYGLIGDPDFFAWCEANAAAALALDPAAIAHAVASSVEAKARVVAADEYETRDIRALLNLGHTFGHALEAETGYSQALLHGEAVAVGMAQAFRFGAWRGLCPEHDAERVTQALAAAGLPTTLQDIGLSSAPASRLLAHMAHDKKREGATLPFILARGIGDALVARDVPLAAVEEFLIREGATGPA